jgi:hypothetical protein
MAKRTEDRPAVLGQPQPPAGRNWLAIVVIGIVALAVVAGGIVDWRRSQVPAIPPMQSPPAAASPVASAPAAPPTAAPAPASLAAFAALPPAQQQAEMQQAVTAYDAVLAEAISTLDQAPLSEVATGGELAVLQKTLDAAFQRDQPERVQDHFSILHIVMSPQPYTFVSVDTNGTETDQFIDPHTHQPIGSPSQKVGHTSLTFVIQGGVWKVSDIIQEPPIP